MTPSLGNGKRCPVATGKSGVALILVVGFLALMMVMAVAFAVYMRTESVAAGNFRNDVRVRQLLHVAMARALEDLESNLGPGVCPNWSLSVSTNGSVAISGVTNSPILNWIPCSALVSGITPSPKWIPFSAGREEGRFGYMIVNCSGLLDANTAGGGVRSLGTNVAEIQVEDLSEMGNNPGAFFSSRPYETVQELNAYGVPANLFTCPVTSLVTYSLFPTQTLTFVGGQANQWDPPAQIVQAFQDAGLDYDPIWANNAYKNLLDFVDADSFPQQLDAGCVESVPMINEVDMQYQLQLQSNNTWTALVQFQVEYAYPFVTQSPLSFELKTDLGFSSSSGGVLPAAQNNLVVPLGVIQPYGTVLVPANPIQLTGGPIPVARFPVKVQCTLNMKIRTGGVDCDAVPAGAAAPMTFTIDISATNAGQVVQNEKWIECIDPRFNWDPNDFAQWVPGDRIITVIPTATPTLNDINKITEYFLYPGLFGQVPAEDYDGDLSMYVANAPLRTVGELGYLCYAPLRTIRLFAHSGAPSPHPENAPFHKVLDYFAVDDNRPVRGLVNPNTKTPEVLATAFVRMPTRDFDPVSANWAPISRATALSVASDVIAQGTYTNVSDLGRIDWRAYIPGPTNELVNESFLRNTSGLLSCRQNLFLIILYAQATRQVPNLPDKSVVAGARAIAEVWRDPMTNSFGTHPRFVRLFKMLNNE